MQGLSFVTGDALTISKASIHVTSFAQFVVPRMESCDRVSDSIDISEIIYIMTYLRTEDRFCYQGKPSVCRD